MIQKVEVENFGVYASKVVFSLEADMRSTRLGANVHQENGWNILKSACLFGANNSGKTCMLKAIRALWGIITRQGAAIQKNLFSKNTVTMLAVSFLLQSQVWRFEVRYDNSKKEFVFEEFARINKDKYSNESKEVFYIRDALNDNFDCKDAILKPVLKVLNRRQILIHAVDTTQFESLKKVRRLLNIFASGIVIVDMNNIPLEKTIGVLKTHSADEKAVKDFIVKCDLDMDDIKYSEKSVFTKKDGSEEKLPAEEVLFRQNIEDSVRLTSVYHGINVRSFQFDSTGTKKITAIASFVVEALRRGQTLIVDELDSSLHFKLTRAIAALFNNELNETAQLIFTLHDISLLDCKNLFRKEQIWFVNKTEDGSELYPLSRYTAEQGVRETSDIIEKYKKGIFASIPEPDLLSVLLEVKSE